MATERKIRAQAGRMPAGWSVRAMLAGRATVTGVEARQSSHVDSILACSVRAHYFTEDGAVAKAVSLHSPVSGNEGYS